MSLLYQQAAMPYLAQNGLSSDSNTIQKQDEPFHDWYRFVLSYPPHLVRDYFDRFHLDSNSTILDPFCGTGTTVVEAKLNGLRGVGLEANPFPHFAASTKVDWSVDPTELQNCASRVAAETLRVLQQQGIDDLAFSGESEQPALRRLPPEAEAILIKNSISPLPLHKTLVLLDQLEKITDSPAYKYCLLALGKALVDSIGNIRFGPEVGVGKAKADAPVVHVWLAEMERMAEHLRLVQDRAYPHAIVHHADARALSHVLQPQTIDAVITSPPYPNEKDYTRTTRLESVVLGFFQNKMQLRSFKKTLLRSNTRGVYKADEDDRWIAQHDHIRQLASTIEAKRIELGKTSGFEKQYARVTLLYFGGMARHLAELQSVLKPGAQLAYVVGDQASYLRIMIRTGQLLADVARDLGYDVMGIDLFRTRFATATQSELREEVLLLRWPG